MNTKKIIQTLTTIVLFLAIIWAGLLVMTFWNRLQILINRDGYHRAKFVVQSVEYQESVGSGETAFPACWANGIINGQKERLSLLSILHSIPVSLKEAQLAVPVGTTFDVLYNPNMSRIIIQGETLRVIPFEDNFWEKQKRLTIQMAKKGFLPLLLALLAKVLTSRWIISQNKSKPKRSNNTPEGRGYTLKNQ